MNLDLGSMFGPPTFKLIRITCHDSEISIFLINLFNCHIRYSRRRAYNHLGRIGGNVSPFLGNSLSLYLFIFCLNCLLLLFLGVTGGDFGSLLQDELVHSHRAWNILHVISFLTSSTSIPRAANCLHG